ncbi:hypothetical protein [Nitratiruptor sp. YY09-18]|uniref:hypothetical protein n=1 Tax=Nitratiruptor sp. YY09-18 TaxID=2724901 RepID=UPI0019165E1E|nr:hypothetical protein [Nitratiruptor sp. YY09-18]BCD68662.1 hypothetical protein NitYY0918_C1579 [Nitratiruptor sp. YY09-18]
MSDYEKFKELDPQEVHKKTFISPRVIANLQNENFKKLGTKAKALGFVKIIERELHLDLRELREKIEEYFSDNLDYNSAFIIKEKSVAQSFAFGSLLKILIFVIILIGGFFVYHDFIKKDNNPPPAVQPVVDENITQHVEKISEPSSEQNATVSNESGTKIEEESSTSSEENVTSVQAASQSSEEISLDLENNETNSSGASQEVTLPHITIIPKKRIWLGIIYLDNYRRKMYSTARPIELNTSRDQLILTGHGAFFFDIDGKKVDYNLTGKGKFIYRAGELEKLDTKTFKEYNRGRVW